MVRLRKGLRVSYGAWRGLRNGLAAVFVLATPVLADEITIAALGDSLTQGYGLPVEEGFTAQLEAWLTEAGAQVQIVNAGVSGDTTAGGLARVAWTLTPEVDAMIVALGGNDLLRGLDPAMSRANLAGILDAARAQDLPVLLVGMEAPGNYGPVFKEEFDRMYPELAAEYDTVFAESWFQGFEIEGQDLSAARDLMQADGIHPNATGVAAIVEGLGPQVLELVARVEG